MKDIVSCSKNKLKGIKDGEDSISKTLMNRNENVKRWRWYIGRKSEEINSKIMKINAKLNELEKLKNTKKDNDDLKIRSLKF